MVPGSPVTGIVSLLGYRLGEFLSQPSTRYHLYRNVLRRCYLSVHTKPHKNTWSTVVMAGAHAMHKSQDFVDVGIGRVFAVEDHADLRG